MQSPTGALSVLPAGWSRGDDPYYGVRQALLEQINRDRSAAGLQVLELDLFCSQIEDQHCLEMAGHHYLAHWNLRGLLPYHRYHFAGGRDYVQENLSRTTTISSDPYPIPGAPAELLPYLMTAHQRFMDEQPPLDGHRRAVLDPGHTHVGVGLAVAGGEFTMAELFVKRYVRIEPLPPELPRRVLRVEGEVLREDFGPFYAALFYEGIPQPHTPEQLNRTYAYTDPNGQMCANLPPWKMTFDFRRRRFRFSLPFREQGPGYYRFLMWVRQPARSIPYRLSRPGQYEVRTEDGIACASWVFKAEV